MVDSYLSVVENVSHCIPITGILQTGSNELLQRHTDIHTPPTQSGTQGHNIKPQIYSPIHWRDERWKEREESVCACECVCGMN